MIDQPGIYEGVPAANYHADPCPVPSLNRGCAVDIINLSPLHAAANHPRLNPDRIVRASSPAMNFGQAAHDILRGHVDEMDVIDARTWQGKTAQAQKRKSLREGRIPILIDVYNRAVDMCDTLGEQLEDHDDERLCTAFAPGHGLSEATVVWIEGEDGGDFKIWCRCRLDWLTTDCDLVLDYKTSDHPITDQFITKQLADGGLDVQAAFYRRGVQSVTRQPNAPDFMFIWQETFPPYDWRVIRPSNTFEVIGDKKVRFAIQQFAEMRLHQELGGDVAGYDKRPQFIEPWPSYEAAWLAREIRAEDERPATVQDAPAPGGLHPLDAG